MNLKIADWVTTEHGGTGIVKRIAKDNSWADVRWKYGEKAYSKRMPISSLIIQHSIERDGFVITDMNREKELRGE